MQELPILNSHLRTLGMRENGNEGSSDIIFNMMKEVTLWKKKASQKCLASAVINSISQSKWHLYGANPYLF